jgi:hypothetical protein
MNLKKEFDVVFQPRHKELYGKRRFLISINRLHEHIGVYNANTAVLKALNSKDDKIRLKFRKFGTVDIYRK